MDESLYKKIQIILQVWAALMLLLALTVVLAMIPMGAANLLISLLIALLKLTLVAYFYMHLRTAIVPIRLASLPAIALLGALIMVTTVDYVTRISPFAPWQ